MVKFVTEVEVASLIESGSTVAMTGFGGMSQCEKILKGIRKRFLEENQPNNLTIYHPSGQSDGKIGIEHIALEGLVKRVIGAHWGLAPKMSQLIQQDKVEAYCLPQGQLTHLFRTIANKLPGHISPIGLRTFVDPRINGGKVNQITEDKEDIVDLIHIGNKDYLFYKSISFDYVLIRGTTVDENGNLTTEEEPLKLEILTAAQAAKACGGKVIVQAKYLAKKNTLHPKEVQVPGFLVDYVVLAEDYEINHRQTPDFIYNPIYNGNLQEPEKKIESIKEMNEREIIGNRAYLELERDSVINLGIGIPGDVIGPIVKEKGGDLNITSTVESGPIGGVPAGKNQFGISKNPEAIISQASQFDFYHGAAVDVTFMGAGEIDRYGNVNVSKFSNRIVGCGGFMDITQATKKVVFCSTFTAGGFDVVINTSSIKINREGSIKKFVEKVDLITFSGEFALEHGIEVYYITERAVFILTPEGLKLTEIADGIDLEKDVLEQMEFQPIISGNLQSFDQSVYTNGRKTQDYSYNK